jgi:hypothetical protein
MGPINDDELHTIFLVNALNNSFESVQSNVMSLISDSKNFTSKTVVRRLLQEDQLICRRAEQNTPAPSSTILATQGQGKPCSLCTNCMQPGHLANFCIKPGGKMAGRSINEACNAQRAASGRHPCTDQPLWTSANPPSSAKVATSDTKATTSTTSPDSLVIGSITYYPGAPPQTSNACVALKALHESG